MTLHFWFFVGSALTVMSAVIGHFWSHRPAAKWLTLFCTLLGVGVSGISFQLDYSATAKAVADIRANQEGRMIAEKNIEFTARSVEMNLDKAEKLTAMMTQAMRKSWETNDKLGLLGEELTLKVQEGLEGKLSLKDIREDMRTISLKYRDASYKAAAPLRNWMSDLMCFDDRDDEYESWIEDQYVLDLAQVELSLKPSSLEKSNEQLNLDEKQELLNLRYAGFKDDCEIRVR